MRALSALFARLLRVVAAAAAFIYQTISICLCCIIHNSMPHSLTHTRTHSHFIVLLHNGSSVCAACGSVCLGLERKRLRPRFVCVSVCLPSVCVATLVDREYYIERRSSRAAGADGGGGDPWPWALIWVWHLCQYLLSHCSHSHMQCTPSPLPLQPLASALVVS